VADGETIAFGGTSVTVVATPGHTADSVCYLVGGALFTGDHIMGGSTVMVEDMADYMESLEKVRNLRPDVIHPGHGPVIDEPGRTVDEYIAHRRDRERQILAAVSAGARSVGEIVQRVYADVDPSLHPAAAISVEAHLDKLAAEGAVGYEPGGWNGEVSPA
jgi:glyoxylase-like metal-dependent hydrolase (beta-lactamase superfamily II)